MTDHGGSLEEARAAFPDAPEPWVDLSTGINPHAYPQLELPAAALTRLPEPARIAELCAVAAQNYGAPQAGNVVAAPGTQILLPQVASLVAPGRARILGPTYAEHIRACALAGHDCEYVATFDALHDADVAVIVNPNNPDGRLIARQRLIELARHLTAKGGLLVVDEAFMDVDPAESLAAEVQDCGAVVLKSFGKFFGLAGVRLGFAIAQRDRAQQLASTLGPWAVSGVALHYGLAGLADRGWQSTMRARLAGEARALDALLAGQGLPVSGGCSLFRFVETPRAATVFERLGRAGIHVRRFADLPDALRFGLPADEQALGRLEAALAGIEPVRERRLSSA